MIKTVIASLLMLLVAAAFSAKLEMDAQGKQILTMPTHLETFQAKMINDANGVPILSHRNIFMYLNLHIGTDKTNTYKLLLDTTEGFLTVTSSLCAQCWMHPRYNAKQSKTYERDGRPVQWHAQFQFFGELARDNLELVGSNFTLRNVTFAQLIKCDDSWVETANAFDGFIGLPRVPTYDDTGKYAFPGLMPFLLDQSLIEQNIFAMYLSELYNPREAQQQGKGELVLGGFKSDHYIGEISYVPLIQDRQTWDIEFEGLKINGQWFNYTGCDATNKCQATIDSGVQAIVTDLDTFSYLQLYANASVAADCKQAGKRVIPSFTFVIGGQEYTIDPQDYIIHHQSPIWPHSMLCRGTIVGDELVRKTEWVFGAPFIALFYTVFDAQNQRMGFAYAKHS